jgi:DNA-directed RNA polymerase subunit F
MYQMTFPFNDPFPDPIKDELMAAGIPNLETARYLVRLARLAPSDELYLFAARKSTELDGRIGASDIELAANFSSKLREMTTRRQAKEKIASLSPEARRRLRQSLFPATSRAINKVDSTNNIKPILTNQIKEEKT